MSDVGFVHLHVHSSFSLLEGALPIARLAELAKADRQPALALTDTDNMFGVLEFSEKLAGLGIQPIIGCSLALDCGDGVPESRTGASEARLPRLVLIAAREEGYRRLIKLTSRAFLETPSDARPHIKLAWLEDETAGLIALTGGPSGMLDMELAAGRQDRAMARADALQRLFGDRLYIELQRHGLRAEKLVEPGLVDIAYTKGLPLVAANEPFFARESDYEAHDALLCIAEGRLIADAERRQLSPEHRFKTRAEMMALFADLPEALASTVDVAERCAYRPTVRKPILPRFTATLGADAIAAEGAELRRQAHAGLIQRIAAHGTASGVMQEEYEARLAFELDVIERMKYPGYFLIVADFIQWAKGQGIPVGPGRGSGAGSLVAYSLAITDLDPIRFGLIFERFLNPERVSMPDFDIDFCQDRRDEVIRYVQGRYGREQVAQIITFGTLQARGVLRDVGRVLEMPYGQVDRLCKLVPQNPAAPISLKKAIEEEPRLQAERDAQPVVARAFDIAVRLEGLNRHASTHAAGIVIGDRPLAELVPLYRDPKSDMPVTQFNMKWVEQAGLVKFDFLGLTTLTVLQRAVELVARRGIALDLLRIPLDDPKPYDMLARGEVVGVFQVESAGMRRALIDMRPDRFEDIIALVALYRPGPMANIPTYCARKQGDEQPDYIHPKLEPILRETFGVIVYQEQVMQAAQLLAGFTLGEADLLRRAMGKKDRKEMKAQRERFVSGAAAHGIDQAHADTIFDLLERFAEYGFNKSHAAAYALVAYQTAFMKAHYPVEFIAASMTLAMQNTDKLSEFRAEAQRMGIKVEPPSVNRSGVTFEVEGGAIRYALAALKGVGAQAVESIVAARAHGPFRDLTDFATRINPRAVNKRVLESLACAGAFDEIEPDRARAHAAVDAVLGFAQRRHEASAVGQDELFGGGVRETLPIPAVATWLPGERLGHEYDAVGFFLSGHPLDDYAAVLKKLKVETYAEFARQVRDGATAGRVAATVVSRTERRTKTGNRMGILGLSDPTGHYEAVIFAEGLAQYRDVLEPGAAVLLFLTAEANGDEVRARIATAEPLDAAAEKTSQSLRVFLRDAASIESLAKRLEPAGGRGAVKPSAITAAASAPGYGAAARNGANGRNGSRAGNGQSGIGTAGASDGEVNLVLLLAMGEVEIKLPGRFKVSPQIAGAIKAVPGVETVEAV